MAINLINILQRSFSDKSYQDISDHVGIGSESTKNGLRAIIPTVLSSILRNKTISSSTQPSWWNELDNEYPYSEDEFILTDNLNNSTFLVKGREVTSSMFRTNHEELVTSISSISGVQREKAAGLIEVGVPLIVGHLKNWMRKKGWKFNDLIENLIENKVHIKGALPIGLTPAHFEVVNTPKENFSETIESEIPTTGKPKIKKNNGVIWFIGLLIITLLLWYFMGSRACSRLMNKDDVFNPGIRDTIANIYLYEKPIDGTYYAYDKKLDPVIRAE